MIIPYTYLVYTSASQLGNVQKRNFLNYGALASHYSHISGDCPLKAMKKSLKWVKSLHVLIPTVFSMWDFSHENLLYLWTFLLIHFLGAEIIVGKVNERILFFLDISLCMMFFFRKSFPTYELFLIFTWTTSKHRSLSTGSSLV